MINVGDRIVVEKGCKARYVTKGTRAIVMTVCELGPDYSHQVKVVLRLRSVVPRDVAFFAQHINRLSDPTVNLNDGNPTHKIVVRKIA